MSDWAVNFIRIFEETCVSLSDLFVVLRRVMIDNYLWSKWNVSYFQSLQTFARLINVDIRCKSLRTQDLSVSNFLTCNASQAERLFMTFPSLTGRSDLIWECALHDNISSNVLCLAIFLEKNTCILVLKRTILDIELLEE